MKDRFAHLRETLDNLPMEPGVYKIKDSRGKILYIGKAKVLRHRVRSYFQPSANHSARISIMVGKAKAVEVIVTASELEALVLEDNLIKKEKPHYNIDLKDDKHYPYLKLTINEKFPRLLFVRRVEKDGARYFGPYVSAKSVRATQRLIHKIFPLRQSSDQLDGTAIRRPCLNHQMGRCLAPCAGKTTLEEYAEQVEEVSLFLKGKNRELLKTLKTRMMEESKEERFEQAGRFRDQIDAIERINERQLITQTNLANQDILAAYEEGGKGIIMILQTRRGKLNAEKSFWFSRLDRLDRSEALGAFIRQFYSGGMEIPGAILTQETPEGADALMMWLTEKRGAKTIISTPLRGKNRKLLEMAERNAKMRLKLSLNTEQSRRSALEDLVDILELEEKPLLIEGYDISNTSGVSCVGSIVVFRDGASSKGDYRKYKIKSVTGPDDYASMAEVVERRYKRLYEEGGEFADLMVIDGGKGQVSAVVQAFKNIGVIPPPIVGIAKGKERENLETDQLFIPGDTTPIEAPLSSPGKLLLQTVRDEAHRFAISFHRKLRGGASMKSALDTIPGVGPKRKKALLRKFGSVKRIREASVEDVSKALSVSEKVAREILERL